MKYSIDQKDEKRTTSFEELPCPAFNLQSKYFAIFYQKVEKMITNR